MASHGDPLLAEPPGHEQARLTNESADPGPHSATGRSASRQSDGQSGESPGTDDQGRPYTREAVDSGYRYDSEAAPTMTDFDMSYHRGGASGAAAGP
jgi:hypothetical protein